MYAVVVLGCVCSDHGMYRFLTFLPCLLPMYRFACAEVDKESNMRFHDTAVSTKRGWRGNVHGRKFNL